MDCFEKTYFFLRGIRLLPARWKKVVDSDGAYFVWNHFTCFCLNKQVFLFLKRAETFSHTHNIGIKFKFIYVFFTEFIIYCKFVFDRKV